MWLERKDAVSHACAIGPSVGRNFPHLEGKTVAAMARAICPLIGWAAHIAVLGAN
jgi:hypothetical protein